MPMGFGAGADPDQKAPGVRQPTDIRHRPMMRQERNTDGLEPLAGKGEPRGANRAKNCDSAQEESLPRGQSVPLLRTGSTDVELPLGTACPAEAVPNPETRTLFGRSSSGTLPETESRTPRWQRGATNLYCHTFQPLLSRNRQATYSPPPQRLSERR
jgi:hypothetical protein